MTEPLAISQKVPGPLSIPEFVPPGTAFLWPRRELNAPPVVGGIRSTYVSKGDQYLAGVGLESNSVVTISGYLQTHHSLWSTPIVEWYLYFIKIDQAPSSKVADLQIPRDVWSRLSAVGHDKRSKERQRMRHLTYQSEEPLDVDCFTQPLKKLSVSSRFASPRRLPNGKSYLHSGVDLRAKKGTKVFAAASGVVELAEKMVVSGQTVILDHGGGLHSAYFHLSHILTAVDQVLSSGDTLGEAGATGRAEAPHLHWEIVWKGRHLNPLAFLKLWDRKCKDSLSSNPI